MKDQIKLAEMYARQNPGLVDRPLKGEWLRYDQHKDETVWIDMYEKKVRFVTRNFNGDTYMLTSIPDEGLWGHYYGQGDLQWAWVRLSTWKKWVREDVLREFDSLGMKNSPALTEISPSVEG